MAHQTVVEAIESQFEQAKQFRHDGRYNEAVAALRLVLDLSREYMLPPAEARAHGELGLNWKNLGHYDAAIAAFQQSLYLYRQQNQWRQEAATLTNLGATYSELGRVDDSLALYAEAKSLYTAHDDRRGMAICEVFLGTAYFRIGQLDVAETHYHAADALYAQIDDPLNQGHVRTNLGALAHKRGDPNTTIRYTEQALTSYRAAGNTRGVLAALNNLGASLMDLGDFGAALGFLEEAFALAEKHGMGDVAWRIAGNVADWYLQQGDALQAITLYQRALMILDDVRAQLQSRTSRLEFVRLRLHRYADLINVAVKQAKMPALAFECVERARSRVLIEDLATSQFTAPPQLSAAWIEEEHALLRQLYQLRDSSPSTTTLERIEAVQQQLEQHQHLVRKHVPEYLGLRQGDQVSFQDVVLLLT